MGEWPRWVPTSPDSASTTLTWSLKIIPAHIRIEEIKAYQSVRRIIILSWFICKRKKTSDSVSKQLQWILSWDLGSLFSKILAKLRITVLLNYSPNTMLNTLYTLPPLILATAGYYYYVYFYKFGNWHSVKWSVYKLNTQVIRSQDLNPGLILNTMLELYPHYQASVIKEISSILREKERVHNWYHPEISITNHDQHAASAFRKDPCISMSIPHK